MSQLFKNYEEEFISLSAAILKKINSIPMQSSYKKQMAFVDIREELDECDKIVKRMDTESSSLDPQIKFQYTRQVRSYKKDFSDLKKKLMKAEDDFALEKNKEMLMGAQLDEEKISNKDKLIKQGEMLSDTNYKLKDSVRVMRETQEISDNIGVQLTRHTQQMKGNKEKLIDMRDDIGQSERKVKNIMFRIRKNKAVVMLVVIGAVLIGIIMLIVRFA